MLKKNMLCSVVAGLSLSGVVVVLDALPFFLSRRSGVQNSRDSWCKRQMVTAPCLLSAHTDPSSWDFALHGHVALHALARR